MHNPLFRNLRSLLTAALFATALGLALPPVPGHADALAAVAAPRPPASLLAQDGDSDEDTEVSSDQIEKYVAVYKDMQRDRNLTVEQAAAKEGLTLTQFRELEQKIGHDDLATERARNELQAAAAQATSPASAAAPPKN